jgi:hypothetical protein
MRRVRAEARRAAAAVEFAIVLPLVALLLAIAVVPHGGC